MGLGAACEFGGGDCACGHHSGRRDLVLAEKEGEAGVSENVELIALLLVALYCIAQTVRDISRKSFIWAAAGAICVAAILLMPARTTLLKLTSPAPIRRWFAKYMYALSLAWCLLQTQILHVNFGSLG